MLKRFAFWILVGVCVVAVLLPTAFFTQTTEFKVSLPGVMAVSLVTGLIASGVILVIVLTSKTPATAKPRQPVKRVLDDPYVRRTILRIELGGILAGIGALCFAIWGLYEANTQSRLAQAALQEQRISSAWVILASPGRGSTGKSYALDILVSESTERLSGLDLGCYTDVRGPEAGCSVLDVSGVQFVGRDEPLRQGRHIERSDLRGMIATKSGFKNIVFDRVDLGTAEVQGAQFEDVVIKNSRMQDVHPGYSFQTPYADDFTTAKNLTIMNSSLTWSVLRIRADGIKLVDLDWKDGAIEGELNDLEMSGVDLTGTDIIEARFDLIPESAYTLSSNPFFTPTNTISGTKICADQAEPPVCAQGLNRQFFELATFAKDNPPLGMEHLETAYNLPAGCIANAADSAAVALCFPD